MTDQTPRPGPLVRLAVRRRLRTELESKGRKLNRQRIADLMAVVSDEAIDDAAGRVGATAPAGGIVDWLRDNQELIGRVVALILAVLGV